jgi:hypothetical protein
MFQIYGILLFFRLFLAWDFIITIYLLQIKKNLKLKFLNSLKTALHKKKTNRTRAKKIQ